MAIILSRKPGGAGGGGAPSGPAGGDLSGTYPNPSIANNVIGAAEIDGSDAAAIRTELGVAESAKIFDSTLGADAASIDTGAGAIPGTYSVLEVWMIMRTTQATVGSSVIVNLNADAGANYDQEEGQWLNASATGGPGLAVNGWTLHAFGANAQAGAATSIIFTIPGYSATTFHKMAYHNTAQVEDTAADARIRFGALRWRNTAAITRLAVAAVSGNLLAGSRLLIYGR